MEPKTKISYVSSARVGSIVISTIDYDSTSSKVIEWLGDENVVRINNDVPPDQHGIGRNIGHSILDLNVKSIWFRKGGYSKVNLRNRNEEIIRYATDELYAMSGILYGKSPKVKVLGTSEFMSFNKLAMLRIFKEFQLEIPPTDVIDSRNRLLEFRAKNGRLIFKPMSEGIRFEMNGINYKTYTEELTDQVMDTVGERFFPTLFQKLIEREFEIRSFYLAKEIYSMAVFTATTEATEVDHRIYTQRNEVRMVPYKLPDEIESKIEAVMSAIGLNTGSFDIIKGIDGIYYFLELNPAGQFGGLSYSCNYFLERKVANFLKNENTRSF